MPINNKYAHVKSSVSGKVPTANNLLIAEISVNLADHVLHSKDTANNVFLIKADPLYNTGLQANLDLKANVADTILTGSATANNLQISGNFQVLSSSLVTNLNADLLDGFHSSAFSANNHLHTGVYEPANTNIQLHIANTSNPHAVTKSQVGLGNVDNTADVDKSVSHSQTSNNANYLDGLDSTYFTANSLFASHTANTSNPHSVTKTQVGLGNVDNTADVDKSVSHSQTSNNANYLDGQDGSFYAPIDSPVFTGIPTVPTASTGTSNTQIASTAFVHNQVIVDKPLTGFASNNGIITSSDTILSAIQKLDGNDRLKDYIVFNNNATTTSNTQGSMLWDATYKTLDLHLNNINLQIGQEEVVLCYNGTANTIYNGSIVEMVGANGDYPSVAPAIAQGIVSALIIGMATEDIPSGGMGFVTHRGIIHDIDTHLYSPGTRMYLSDTVPGGWSNVPPSAFGVTTILIGVVLRSSATTGSIYVRQILNNRLSDLSDTFIQSPVTDQVLKYNGSEWVNGDLATISPGSGISFFPNDTTIIPAGSGPQTVPMFTMSKMPSANTEVVQSRTVNDSTEIFERFLSDMTIGSTSIDAGIWAFENYGYVSSGGATSTIPVSIYRQFAGTGTVTITGSGTSRTATVTGNSPFISTDANTSIELASALQTTNGIFEITGYSNTSVVTVRTLSTYTNETSSAYYVHRLLFSNALTNITATSVGLITSTSTQPAYVVNPTDKLSFAYFAKSSGNRTIYWYHNGTTHYSHVTTPLVTQHNSLPGLQGGNSTERYHLSAASYAVVQATSGINSGDQTNISGNAATATNADLLDGQHGTYYTANTLFASHTANTSNPHAVTSSQIGLGNVTNESKSVMFTSPVFTGTPSAPTPASGTSNTQIATTQFVQDAVTLAGSYTGWTISDGTNSENVATGQTIKIEGAGISSTSYSAANNTLLVYTPDFATSANNANYLDGLDSTYFTANSVFASHASNTSNPHAVTKAQVGLGNVDNTADADKNVNSALTANNSTYFNGQSSTYYATSSDLTSHTGNTSNPHSVTKTQVGLGNVDNESKATMFTNPVFTGTAIANTVVINGDLYVNGSTTTVNTAILVVEDKNIEIGSVSVPSDITADGGGITLKGSSDKTITWDLANSNWSSSENWNLASGKVYKINNASILSSTTLGSSVVNSSLTSVGTITSGTWSGSFGIVSGANLTNLTAGNLTGTIPSGVLGNSSLYVGTTSIVLNRASGSQSLTGVSIDGSAGSVAAANITGTTLASNVVSSSLTSVGTLTNLTVTNPISGSITGTASNITGTYAGTITSSQITTGLGFTPYNDSNPSGYITSSGSITGSAGSVAGTNITGTTLASNIVNSSLTGVGTLTSGTINLTTNITTTGVGYFGPASPLSLTNPLLVATSSVDGYSQMQVQNTSDGSSASSDWIATADNGSDTSKYIDLGINNSGYSVGTWTISGANDGYLYINGGNLTLGTDTAGKTVSIHTGGTLAANIVTTFNASGTDSANTTTGAVVITGGLGVSKNITANTATFVSGLTANNATLTGIPTAPTASTGTNTTQVATTAFVQATKEVVIADSMAFAIALG